GHYVGYGVLVTLGLLCALASTWLLAKVPEPARSEADADAPDRRSARERFLEPFGDPAFREVLIFGSAFQFAAVLAGPYFTYYFTHDLKIPLSLAATWGIIANAGCVVAAVFWGRRVDRPGDRLPIDRVPDRIGVRGMLGR